MFTERNKLPPLTIAEPVHSEEDSVRNGDQGRNVYTESCENNNCKKIGEGSFGCVFREPFKCKNDIIDFTKYKDKVSKVMTTKNAQNELNEYNSIQQYSTQLQKYAIIAPKLCEPIIDDPFRDAMKQCSETILDPEDTRLLIYQDGGIDIIDQMELFDDDTYTDKLHFLASLVNLLDGLLVFQNIGIIHRDIRCDNIVYNARSHTAKFIDFGMMCTKEAALVDINNSKWDYLQGDWLPPEVLSGCINRNKFVDTASCGQYNSSEEKPYGEFLNIALDTYDIYCLSKALWIVGINIFHLKENIDIDNREELIMFSLNLKAILIDYTKPDVTERHTEIRAFKNRYIELLRQLPNSRSILRGLLPAPSPLPPPPGSSPSSSQLSIQKDKQAAAKAKNQEEEERRARGDEWLQKHPSKQGYAKAKAFRQKALSALSALPGEGRRFINKTRRWHIPNNRNEPPLFKVPPIIELDNFPGTYLQKDADGKIYKIDKTGAKIDSAPLSDEDYNMVCRALFAWGGGSGGRKSKKPTKRRRPTKRKKSTKRRRPTKRKKSTKRRA